MGFLFSSLLFISILPAIVSGELFTEKMERVECADEAFNFSINLNYSDFGGYAILVTPFDSGYEEILFASVCCGFPVTVIRCSAFAETSCVKKLLSDTVSEYGQPGCIIIVSDESLVAPYRERINPFTGRFYPDDSYFGIVFTDSGCIEVPVSRIPVRSPSECRLFGEKTLKRLMSDGASDIVMLAPFYDQDGDSTEDYLHFTLSLKSSSLSDSFSVSLLGSSDSPFPKYSFDGSPLPDSFTLPLYDWDASASDLVSALNQNSLAVYRGHGNVKELVFPHFTLSDIDAGAFSCLAFASFSCLTGSFDSILYPASRSFCESLMLCREGPISAIGASSETFYQYNNLMFSLFGDCINDSVLSDFNSHHSLCFKDIFAGVKNCFSSIVPENEYSKSQLCCYTLFGFPLFSLKSGAHQLPIYAEDSVDAAQGSFSVSAPDGYTVYLNNRDSILDSCVSSCGVCVFDIWGMACGRWYFVSAYREGVLLLDSFFLKPGSLIVENLRLEELCGDGDSIAENMEEALLRFDIESENDGPCILSFSSEGFLPDRYSDEFNVADGFCTCSLPGRIDSKDSIRVSISCGELLFRFRFSVASRTLSAESLKKAEGGFIFTGDTDSVDLFMSLGDHPYDSAFIKLIDGLNCGYELSDTLLCIDSAAARIRIKVNFTNSPAVISAVASNSLMCETLAFHAYPEERNSILLLDPLNLYGNSQFTDFINDSLCTEIVRCTLFSPAPKMPSIFAAAGVFPYNHKITEDDAAAIIRAAGCGSTVYLEGGDALGYDRAGMLMWDMFGILSACDGNDIEENVEITDSLFGFRLLCDTVIRYADSFSSKRPYLTGSGSIIGTWTDSTLCSSVPIRSLSGEDIHAFYYSFISRLCGFVESAEFQNSLNLQTSSRLKITNRGREPLMLSIESFPSFIDSAETEGGRIVLPGSYAFIRLFFTRVPQFKTGILAFSTGLFEHTVRLYSSPMEQTKQVFRCYADKTRISVYAPEDYTLRLPPSVKWGIHAEKTDFGYVIEGDIFLLSGKSIEVSNGAEKQILKVPLIRINHDCSTMIPETLFYDILGAKRKRRESQRILFSKNGKVIFLR